MARIILWFLIPCLVTKADDGPQQSSSIMDILLKEAPMAYEAAFLVSETILGSSSGFSLSHLFDESDSEEEEEDDEGLKQRLLGGLLMQVEQGNNEDEFGSGQVAPPIIHGTVSLQTRDETTLRRPVSNHSYVTLSTPPSQAKTSSNSLFLSKANIKLSRPSSRRKGKQRILAWKPLGSVWTVVFSAGMTIIVSITAFFICQSIAIHIRIKNNYQ